MTFDPLFVMSPRAFDRFPHYRGSLRGCQGKPPLRALDGEGIMRLCINGPTLFLLSCALAAEGRGEGNDAVEGRQKSMEAYRIGDHVVAADTEEDARHFYREEVGQEAPAVIEELSVSLEVPAGEGKTATIRELMNKTLDERNAWLRMGVPCELHWPFIVAKLK